MIKDVTVTTIDVEPGAPLTPVEELRGMLGEIELDVLTAYTLADAIREGGRVTTQKVGGWGSGREACAMSAAVIAARARGYVE